MTKTAQSLRHQISTVHTWKDLGTLYRNIHFVTPPCERVESYGVTQHGLDGKLSNLQAFWRYHVAPATHRTLNTHLSADVADVVHRIAQRSYEVYANICDALDELDVMTEQGLKQPRYRTCLNVFRCMGDACLLFDELVNDVGARHSPDRQRQPPTNLATALDVDIFFFDDWRSKWSTPRKYISDYRHMLVHHGRPWLFFKGHQEFVGEPYVLEARYCRVPGCDPSNPEYLTWTKQIRMFKNEQDKFITLRQACEDTCDDGIKWLNNAYGRVVQKLDTVLSSSPDKFEEYKRIWGIRPSSTL